MRTAYLLLILALPLISCSQDRGRQSTDPVMEDKFITLKFEFEGKPCEAVINKEYKGFKEKNAYPLSLFITVSTGDQDQNGHPTEKEAEIFYTLQTHIIAEMSAEFSFCHAGTTTMTGYRDILLYISPRDQEKASGILTRIKSEDPRITSFTFEEDPEWEAVAGFYEAI